MLIIASSTASVSIYSYTSHGLSSASTPSNMLVFGGSAGLRAPPVDVPVHAPSSVSGDAGRAGRCASTTGVAAREPLCEYVPRKPNQDP